MAETIPVITEDPRLELISQQLVNFANADFSSELNISEQRDSIDSIIIGLNLLGEELKAHIAQAQLREADLKEALHRLNVAQHLSHIGSWEWNIPENKIEWTDELFRLYGRERGSFETTFENYLNCIHPEDRDFVNGKIQNAYQDHQPFDFFHRIMRADGIVRIHHSRGEVFTGADDRPYKMTGTAQDVTAIKEAESKTHRLAAIVESSSDAIISKTLKGYITSWNRKAEEIFGYTADEIVGKHVSILFPEERLSEEEAIMQEIRDGRSVINYETIRKRKDGTPFNVAITISPILDSQKRITGVSKVARDITEKKEAEEKLQRYTQELEYKNNETRQFTYVASHDLQEPLRTISNYIGLLANDYTGKFDKNGDLYIKFISRGAERMQVLIHDLLEYTRIENDNLITDVDLAALLKDIVENMQSTIVANNAVITVDSLPVIKGYHTRMNSLFQNLISNSIKFRKKNVAPVIHINATDKGNSWLFIVKDNGIGIEKDYYEKIFMLFQRLHTRNTYEGTGIGLSHCKKIVELRGGKIWVESVPGEGSTFYVELPKKVIL